MKYIGHKFVMIDQLFKLRMNKNLEDLGITYAQMNVLMHLEQHEGEKVTQKQLVQEFNVKHPTMTGILQRMQEKGLIRITVDEENKKFKNIVKTEEADKIKDAMNKYRLYTDSVLLKGFGQEEEEILSGMLDRVFKNLINDTDISDEDKLKLEGRSIVK